MRRKISRSLALLGEVVNKRVWGGWPSETELRNPLGKLGFSFVAVITAAALLVGASSANAGTFRVPADYATINQALDVAVAGDTVLVAPGTYSDPEIRTVNFVGFPVQAASLAFLKEGVTVRSEGGPEVTELDLKQQSAPNGTGFVVVANHLTNLQTTMEGFSITGGLSTAYAAIVNDCVAMRFVDCIFHDLDTRGYPAAGAAGRDQDANVEYFGCQFVRCAADEGAAIFHGHGALTVENCIFEECINKALDIYECLASEPIVVRNSIFRQNRNDHPSGPPLSVWELGSFLVEGCAFVDNIGFGQPSALSAGRSRATIRNNLFLRNASTGLATNAGAISVGGFSQGFIFIEGNTFVSCSTESGPEGVGSAIFLNAGVFPIFQVHNNVFSNCTGSPAIFVWSGNVEHSCNVFWENPDGNMSIPLDLTDRVVDPQFCNPLLDDLTLNASSPCLPPNSLGCGLIGAFGQGCGTVSVESKSWGQIKGLYR